MARQCAWAAHGGSMTERIHFQSHVPKRQRRALEALVFFNSCQSRVSECIAEAVERFGAPEIVADGERLRLQVGALPDVQNLFAVEAATGRPVGVAVYIRPDLEHITVLHLGVAAEYASGGPRAGEHLLLRLLREVRRCARRVKGIRSLELYYVKGKSRSLNPRWRLTAGKAM
ncbi:MAG: hypothetical protein DIU71_02765 [Proteobacteria bacterium]|nr:MAG: hypothetical protein DIU71_02765 [Pseudomonadota bacterium]